MKTPLFIEGKVLSSYKDVSRTFTYGLLATLPLVITYEAGIAYLNAGRKSILRNGADSILEDISTLFGLLPSMMSGFLLVAGVMAMLYYERKKYGFIQTQPFFFFLTFNEALLLGLALSPVTYWLAQFVISLFPHERVLSIIVKAPLSAFNTIHALGAGFYEEIFFRVIMLGGSIALLRFLKVPGMLARIVAITIVSMLFSSAHYIGHYGESYTIDSFLYRSYLGVFLSAIYLWRGFATAAWTHAILDIFVHF